MSRQHAYLLVALLCALPCVAATIRTKSDMRLWQTVVDRSAPLAWPWEDGADSATLVFSNRLTQAVTVVAVPRGEGETRGVCNRPVAQEGDILFDVTLVQSGGGTELARESASLAYVACAGGGPITVRAKGTDDWRRVRAARVTAFDPAWREQEGDSGYDVSWPVDIGLKIRMR